MRGIFHPGDRLVIEPVALSDLHPGDVIVFRKHAPENGSSHDKHVVHRVIAILSGGAITRGDNNAPDDVELVLSQYIVGRVTYFIRDGKKRWVRGGVFGSLRARIAYRLRRVPYAVWQRIRALLRPAIQTPYRLLRRSRIVRCVWKPAITQITIQTTAGPLIKYIHRGRTVIEWWPDRRRYRAKRPYDLIIFPPDASTYLLDLELKDIDDP
jgi:hypothetical protein